MAFDFPDPYPMERWTSEEWRRFHPICDGLEAHGYWISTTPLQGQFNEWLEDKRNALRKVEREAEYQRRAYRFRGMSKNLLAALHRACPEPVWGVEATP